MNAAGKKRALGGGRVGRDERDGEPEGGPDARLAGRADLAAQHRDLLAADAQAQARAARAPGAPHLRLGALRSARGSMLSFLSCLLPKQR